MFVKAGSTDVTIYVRLRDSTTGLAKTGLVYNSAGASAYYTRPGAAAVAITLATQTVTGAHSDGGFVEVHATNAKGLYRLDLPDAAVAAGVGFVIVSIEFDGIIEESIEVDLSPPVDVVAVSGDAAAADNIEATYDGTGYTDDAAPATQAQIGNLSSSSAAISITAESFTKAGAEPETGTYTATQTLDESYHIVEDDASSTDVYYQFDVGGNGIPISITWDGYAQSNGDSYNLYAYNYGATSYEQIGTLLASNGTTPVHEIYLMTVNHVGTGANLGKVRFRIESATGTAFATDRVLCNFAVVQSDLGFVGGAVWVDTVNGESGTTGTIGTVGRPVDNIADAKTIAGNHNLKVFHILPGSSVTLASAFDGYEFRGWNFTVALGGQSVNGTLFQNATITGNDDGTNTIVTVYNDCKMSTNTLGLHRLEGCGLSATITLAEAGTFDWVECYDQAVGAGTASVDVGVAIATTNLHLHGYSGEIELQQLGQVATDNVTLEGNGHLIINANCAGGTVTIRGHFTRTDNSGGAVTLLDDARYDVTQINDEVLDVLTVDTQAELSSVPNFPLTILDMLKWMFTRAKHKTETTATTDIIKKDDETTTLGTSGLSDDSTTFTRGEYS